MRLSARDTRPVSPRVQFTHHSQNVEHMAPAKRRLSIWRTLSLLLVAFLLVAAGCSDASQFAGRGGGDVHIGQLDNGLTYYLDSNWTPHDSLTLILVVKAGSIHETEPESGVAHFVEHMMFNGTEKYPGNTIYDEVREFGLEMGPDLNAFTGFDTTIYFLIGLSDDANAVETGFEVLSQWAHAATIAPAAVESERGVVRDEYRLRSETSDGVAFDTFLRLATADTPYEQHPPIGSSAGIEAATAADLREFYDTWYVPSNMAVIAVGDLSVKRLEELTREYFGSIEAKDPPAAPDTRLPVESRAQNRSNRNSRTGKSRIIALLADPSVGSDDPARRTGRDTRDPARQHHRHPPARRLRPGSAIPNRSTRLADCQPCCRFKALRNHDQRRRLDPSGQRHLDRSVELGNTGVRRSRPDPSEGTNHLRPAVGGRQR